MTPGLDPTIKPYKPKSTPSPGTRRAKAPAVKVNGYTPKLQGATSDIAALLARRTSGQ